MCGDSAQIGTVMRKYICNILIALLLLALLPPLGVRAASGDGLRLDEEGNVTVVSQHASKEGVSSLHFCLSVESTNAAGVQFLFGESRAKIKDFRYDEATGYLKVYLAGTEALFAEGADALTVGKIKVLDGGGNEVTATVSVVENSLQYVYGTEVKIMQGVELPGAVQIGSAVVQPQPSSDPQPPSNPQPPSIPQPPSDPQPSTAPQSPSEPQPPAAPQLPATSQMPVALPTAAPQFPVILPTPRPAQPPRATERPRPTEAPGDNPMESLESPDSQTPESEFRQPEESPSGDVPQLEEDILLLPVPSPGGEKTSDEDSKGVTVFAVIAAVALLVAIVIGGMAFVVLKKPGSSKRRRRRGSEN